MRITLILMLFLSACSSSGSDEETNGDVNKTFFPIAGNINTELKEIDSLPIAVIKYTTIGDKTDTALAEKSELKNVSAMLTNPDISSPELKKYYKEAVFMDNTINTVTMSYTTQSDKPVVRKIEVMIHPETEKVKSIYVEKLEKSGDSAYNRKMVWTSGKSLQVVTIANLPGQAESIKTEKYSWEH
ncbi:MAG TPA: hypothetical protein VK166_09045 [Chitinophagaceae bacterium]|nr:hypothetical protein [Chitinophagaceae bacterium]